jgi:hypothetical protein
MSFGEVALGRDGISGLELAGINALANDALNALVSWERAWHARGNAPGQSESFLARRHRVHLLRMNDILS